MRTLLRRFPSKLQLGETGIHAAFTDKLRVRAALDDAALVDDKNAVGFLHGRQAVGDDERCPVGHHAFKRTLHRAFVFSIE